MRPDTIDPGAAPDGLVARLFGRCGELLAGPQTLDSDDTAGIYGAHAHDLADLHVETCPCQGFDLLLNYGDTGYLIHIDRGLALPGVGSLHYWGTRPDYQDPDLPDGIELTPPP